MTTAIMTSEAQPPSAPLAPRAARTERVTPWARRYWPTLLSGAAILGVGVMLIFTIYFTLFDLQWIAFLFGVLFAAVLSLLSQNIRAQWQLARRTAQLRRSNEKLIEESARGERSAQALKMAETRLRTMMDALPAMIFFVDRDERCRYHNSAFESWCGHAAADITGSPLSMLVDEAIYRELNARGMEALVGNETRYDARWPSAKGDIDVSVKLLPYPVGAQAASGFYAFVTPVSSPRAEVAAPEAGGEAAANDTNDSDTAYREAMEQQITIDQDPHEYLLRAMENDQFILYEQKIEALSAAPGRSRFREILLRLREEEDGMLPPGGFLEVAESYDLMPAIDRWVVRRLLRSCASMKSEDRAWRMPLYCVNVSSATLCDRGFANHVRTQLQHWNIAGSNLCFEINHQDLRERGTDIGILMEALKPLGCFFTVDSFGSDKVSFAPFSQLRFDFIKIDGSIVSEILRDKSELAKARAIVLACGKLGIRTIAQSVEDEAARARLKEIGVDYVQGFAIDGPASLALTPATSP